MGLSLRQHRRCFHATLINHLKPISKLSQPLGRIVRLFKDSGDYVFAIGFEEFVAMAPEIDQPDRPRAVKCHVQRVSGQSRFKKCLLLLDGYMLSDYHCCHGSYYLVAIAVESVLLFKKPQTRLQALLDEAEREAITWQKGGGVRLWAWIWDCRQYLCLGAPDRKSAR